MGKTALAYYGIANGIGWVLFENILYHGRSLVMEKNDGDFWQIMQNSPMQAYLYYAACVITPAAIIYDGFNR